jgi:hypothetical protein
MGPHHGAEAVLLSSPRIVSLISAVNLQIGPDGNKSGPLRWAMKCFDALTGNEQRTLAGVQRPECDQ